MEETRPERRVEEAAKVLWEYHRLGMSPEPAEGILVFGSSDPRVALRAAELFHEGYGAWILVSGGRGRMTRDWPRSEAETFAEVLREEGVPDEAVLLEKEATNTGENIRLTRELLEKRGWRPQRLIVVQKPYMERRTAAALAVQWPGVAFQMTSPRLDWDGYGRGMDREELIHAMVGDMQRILEYPRWGFALEQEVPEAVMAAYRGLVEAGYDRQLMKESKP